MCRHGFLCKWSVDPGLKMIDLIDRPTDHSDLYYVCHAPSDSVLSLRVTRISIDIACSGAVMKAA